MKSLLKIGAELQRVSPAEFPDHLHGKITIEPLIPGIVVRHSCDAGKQVSDAAPQQAHNLGHREVLFQRRSFRMINIARPLGGIAVWAAAESGEEAEFQ